MLQKIIYKVSDQKTGDLKNQNIVKEKVCHGHWVIGSGQGDAPSIFARPSLLSYGPRQPTRRHYFSQNFFRVASHQLAAELYWLLLQFTMHVKPIGTLVWFTRCVNISGTYPDIIPVCAFRCLPKELESEQEKSHWQLVTFVWFFSSGS